MLTIITNTGCDGSIIYIIYIITLNFKVKRQGHNIDLYAFEFSDIGSVLIDNKHKFLQYILPEISHWMRYVMFDLEFQSQWSRSQPRDLFFEFPDIHLVIVGTKHNFLWHKLYYQRYHIERVTSCLTLNFKANGQGHNQETCFFEFPDIELNWI